MDLPRWCQHPIYNCTAPYQRRNLAKKHLPPCFLAGGILVRQFPRQPLAARSSRRWRCAGYLFDAGGKVEGRPRAPDLASVVQWLICRYAFQVGLVVNVPVGRDNRLLILELSFSLDDGCCAFWLLLINDCRIPRSWHSLHDCIGQNTKRDY